MAKFGYVKGVVGYYGKTNKYRSNEKEYCLRIDNPEFVNVDKEALEEAFPLPKTKKDNKRPAKIQSIIDGEQLEQIYFNSSYPINKVWVQDGRIIDEHVVENPDLTGATVMMTLTGVHIGAILMDHVPDEYTPVPFTMEDFGDDELPFN